MKIGYDRVSTREQNLMMQTIALEEPGCDKIYEEVVTGNTKELTSLFQDHPPRGEIVLVVERSFEKEPETLPFKDTQVCVRLNELRSKGLTRSEIARTLSKEINYSRRTLYSWLNKGVGVFENDD